MALRSLSAATSPSQGAAVDADTAPLSQLHLFAALVCGLGFMFDLAEVAFGSALSGVFSAAPYAVSPTALSWLLASAYGGAILGPALGGIIADRYGRRRALITAMLLLSLASITASCSTGIVMLSLTRGISGVFLGAFPPLMITYLTDLLPARHRGRMIMLAVTMGYLGPTGTVFLMRWLTPLSPLGVEGWRWVLVLGGLGAGFAGLLFTMLPEPPRWLFATTRSEGTGEANRLPSLRNCVLVAALSFLAPWAIVAFPLLTGALLIARGASLASTLLTVGLSTFGPFIGGALSLAVADRIERRTAMIVCAAGMTASVAIFYASDAGPWLTGASIAFNLFVALYTPALNLYVAELVPTRVRGRATSWAWSVNRVGAALSPLVLLPLLRGYGAGSVFAVIAAALVVSGVLLAAVGPAGRAGRPVS